MMDYELVGGRVHAQAGRPAALYSYRARPGSASDVMVCQMFPGSVRELPSADAVRQNNEIAFQEATLVHFRLDYDRRDRTVDQ